MPDMPSITIVKRFMYRDVAEDFSNKYHFSGTQPADAAAWKTLADAIIAAEKTCYSTNISFVKAYGYNAGVNPSVAQIDYEALGAIVVGSGDAGISGVFTPGDIAATIRWNTPNFNPRGKRVYLRKYMHGVKAEGSDADKLSTTERPLLATFAAKLIDGTLPGTFKYCGPQGAVASVPEVNQYLTTRTLKRRGKRRPTSP